MRTKTRERIGPEMREALWELARVLLHSSKPNAHMEETILECGAKGTLSSGDLFWEVALSARRLGVRVSLLIASSVLKDRDKELPRLLRLAEKELGQGWDRLVHSYPVLISQQE